jgi:hypothetical protein
VPDEFRRWRENFKNFQLNQWLAFQAEKSGESGTVDAITTATGFKGVAGSSQPESKK